MFFVLTFVSFCGAVCNSIAYEYAYPLLCLISCFLLCICSLQYLCCLFPSVWCLLSDPILDASSKAFMPPCLHCECDHTLQASKNFSQVLHKDKVSLLMKHRLCFDCLGTGHRRAECSQKAVCDVGKESHPTALHRVPLASESSVSSPSTTTIIVSAFGSDLNGSCDTMPIIPVKIEFRHSDNEIPTYAFLDTGSSVW